jgi:hypothetical protein
MPARFLPLAALAAEQMLKSGIKTTEAWLSAIAMLAVIGLAVGTDASPLWGVALAIIAAGYALSRGTVKGETVKALDLAEDDAPTIAGKRYSAPEAPEGGHKPMPSTSRSLGAIVMIGGLLTLTACATPDDRRMTVIDTCGALRLVVEDVGARAERDELSPRQIDVALLALDEYDALCVDTPASAIAEQRLGTWLTRLDALAVNLARLKEG